MPTKDNIVYTHISILVTAVFCLYAWFLISNNGFIWDDPWMVVNNPYVKSLELQNIKNIFTEKYTGQYSPMNTLLYCVLYRFFGLNSFVFHLTCILIHILNTLLVYVFIFRLMVVKGGLGSWTIAFYCALLFGISPMQVESVAWISASKIVLYSFFTLLGFISYLSYIQKQEKKYLIYCLLLFLLAYGSKEQAVIFPLSLLTIHYYISGRFLKSHFLRVIPFLVLALVLGLISMQIQEQAFVDKFETDYYPLWQRFFLACYSITQYLLKVLIPLKQSQVYLFPMQPGDPIPAFYYFYPLTVLVMFYIIYRWMMAGKQREMVFGFLFFFVNLVLALHILPLGRVTVMADRYVYLSVIGIFFAVCLNVNKPWILITYALLIFTKSFFYLQYWAKLK